MGGRILVLDNEYENVSDLIEVLEGACLKKRIDSSKSIFYCERIEEILEQTREMMEKREDLLAFICDAHLGDLMDGDDFIRFLRGYLPYLLSNDESLLRIDLKRIRSLDELTGMLKGRIKRRELLDVLKEHFDSLEDYLALVNYFHIKRDIPAPTVIFCGNPRGVDLTAIEDVPIIQKCNGCEYKVLRYLEESGVFSEEDFKESINNHYRLSPNSQRKDYNPNSNHIKSRKKRLNNI